MISELQSKLLAILAKELFQQDAPSFEDVDWSALLREAEQQSVYAIVYTAVEPYLPEALLPEARAKYYANLAASVRSAHQHGDIHKLLSGHGVPYVIIKGMASASYYPQPLLRAMGDVDFLVPKERLDEAKQLLLGEGYVFTGDETHHAHLAFHRGAEVAEMHWEPNGLPQSEKGDLCRRYLSDSIDTATQYEIQGESFLVPDAFHHGLVMLLHTANHMVNTGVGLRHLCDWAVFAGKLENEAFRDLFEDRLRRAGLWRFAQLLTQVSVRYLGCPSREWAMENVDEALLTSMMTDIFAAGNFGRKDAERINEAKLFTTQGTGTISDSNAVLFTALSEKAFIAMPLCKKVKLLLPLGWAVVAIRHLCLIARGKRPKIHIKKMVSEAEARREIYRDFQLFE